MNALIATDCTKHRPRIDLHISTTLALLLWTIVPVALLTAAILSFNLCDVIFRTTFSVDTGS
jgi:hypothetical protein